MRNVLRASFLAAAAISSARLKRTRSWGDGESLHISHLLQLRLPPPTSIFFLTPPKKEGSEREAETKKKLWAGCAEKSGSEKKGIVGKANSKFCDGHIYNTPIVADTFFGTELTTYVR